MVINRLYDLSQPLSSNAAYLEKLGPFSSSLIFQHPVNPVKVTEYRLTTHAGTRLDSPRHFFSEGDSVDKIPLFRFIGKTMEVCSWQ